jgi:hypothetical protein
MGETSNSEPAPGPPPEGHDGDPFGGIADDLSPTHHLFRPTRREVMRKTTGFVLMGVGGAIALPGLVFAFMMRSPRFKWRDFDPLVTTLLLTGLGVGILLCLYGYRLFRRSVRR